MKAIKEQIVNILKQGVDLVKEDKFDEALPYFNDVLGLKEIMVHTYIQRGRANWEMHYWDEAEKDFHTALAMSPGMPDLEWTTCLMDLQRGKFTWDGLEARWRTKKFDSPRLNTKVPQWRRGLKFNRLFIWSEQGIGDQLLYFSLLPRVLEEGGSIIAMCDARLIPLLQRSFPTVEFVPQTAKIKGIDYQIPVGSLPSQYIHSLDDIEQYRGVNYLKADQARAAALREELYDGRRLIGISWASGAPRIGNHKTAPLMELLPILSVPNTKFVSLQYGNPYAEIFEVEEKTGVQVHVVPQVDNQNGLDDLASLVAACDAVVTVSNVTGHFAGGLGKPTYLLDANKLWYWSNKEGDRNLWYPSVRIFTKDYATAPWAPQIKMIRDELAGERVYRPTFVFYSVGDGSNTWYVTKFVRSLRESNPNADIIMCTDKDTPHVLGVTRRVEMDIEADAPMANRLKAFASLKLDHPAMYLDDDMLVKKRIDPTELLGDKRVKFCKRSFGNDAIFNTSMRGQTYDEHKGKKMGEVYPIVACATVTKDWTVWADLLSILDNADPKYRKWYGDQEAMRVMTETTTDYGTFDEADYGCLPEQVKGRPFIVHYKGDRKEQMR